MTPVLDDDSFRRIRQVVWKALHDWEETQPRTSARPVFEQAWIVALRQEQLTQTLPLAYVRERLYQRWLGDGWRIGWQG